MSALGTRRASVPDIGEFTGARPAPRGRTRARAVQERVAYVAKEYMKPRFFLFFLFFENLIVNSITFFSFSAISFLLFYLEYEVTSKKEGR